MSKVPVSGPLVILVGYVVLILIIAVVLMPPGPTTVPACEEDAVIVGGGDFHDGYWSSYHCEALDDLR